LNAIYSLQFHPPSWAEPYTHGDNRNDSNGGTSWLVGAGKSGLIALWDCSKRGVPNHQDDDNSDIIEPVLSWKGHGGRWIADARFLPPSSDSSSSSNSNSIPTSSCQEDAPNVVPSRLLTAGNDGTICHWDLTSTSVQTGAPKLVCQSRNKKGGLHSGGIFSMDVSFHSSGGGNDSGQEGTPPSNNVWIATGSKDKSIAITMLDSTLDVPLWRSNFHRGKVGCVAFSSSSYSSNPLVASASDDGAVAIHDARLDGTKGGEGSVGAGNAVVAKLEDAHAKPHSVVWKPYSDSMFMTAGLDEIIKLWDLRNTSCPIASYHGHVPSTGKRLKRIHRPTFFNAPYSASMFVAPSSASFILSGGEGSYAISMFELERSMSSTQQHGVLEYDAIKSEEGRDRLQSVFSRGKLPPDVGDIGSLAVNGRDVAVAVEGGEVLLLSPKA